VEKKQRTSRIVRPLRGGQITIPVEFRKTLGINDESLLQMTLEGQELRIRPLRIPATLVGTPWLKELYEAFTPVREQTSRFSEPEIDAALDKAVRASRLRRG
jgi:bifunctional DNA-binding transcriptional regulator/antitoxin component of YhaV-PrlF toxin-antitoxin module